MTTSPMAPPAGARSPLFEPTIARITVRALLGRKRALLLAVPGLVLLGVTLVLKGVATGNDWPAQVVGQVGFAAVVPLTALLDICPGLLTA